MAQGVYWTCEFGANHDHGERCDCAAEKVQEEQGRMKMYERTIKRESSGQMVINLAEVNAV